MKSSDTSIEVDNYGAPEEAPSKTPSQINRRLRRFEESVKTLTKAALEAVLTIAHENGWASDDIVPYLIVEPDQEGGAILILFDEFGRTEWLIDAVGSELMFSRTRRPSQAFYTW